MTNPNKTKNVVLKKIIIIFKRKQDQSPHSKPKFLSCLLIICMRY